MRIRQALYSSELGREVELHVILPDDDQENGRRYPVLYFYDGDRIYDDPKLSCVSALSGSFQFGEYQRVFGRFLPKVLLVGIVPPQDMWKRTAEYIPYSRHFDVPEGVSFEPYVAGRGRLLGEWVVQKLKPWIDRTYRTRPEREYTGIGGLSSGGVNALYMIAEYPEVFGRLLVHAPAVHLWMEPVMETALRGEYSHIKYAYVDIGTDDCTRMVPKGEACRDLQAVLKALEARGLQKEALRFTQVYRGTHECASWRLTFPDALRWTFPDAD